jgi:hypothetical protein
MKIQNKTEIDLSVEDVKVAIGRYLADTHKISFADEVVMHFHVINKPIQHPTYISDTVDKFVFDGVTIIGQNLEDCAGGDIVPLYKQVEVLLNEEQKQAIQYFIDDSDSYDRVGIKETKIAADLLRSILQK